MTELIVDDDQLRGVELADGRVIPRAAVFVRPGNVPHNDGLIAALGCEQERCRLRHASIAPAAPATPALGAGNVVDPRAQVITSAGAGSAAAIAINADLVEDDVAARLHLVTSDHAR